MLKKSETIDLKRYNSGFINLDSLLNISFSQIEKSNHVHYLNKEHYIIEFENNNNKLIYKMQNSIKRCYNELLAYQLASFYNINCAFYDLATLDGTIGVLTINYKKAGVTYCSFTDLMADFGIDVNELVFSIQSNLENIWAILEKKFRDYANKEYIVKNLLDELIKIYCFDILICNSDRHLNNLELAEDKINNKYNIAPIFDHTLSLELGENVYSNIGVKYGTGKGLSHYSVLKDFLEVSSEDYQNMFIEMNENFTLDLLNESLSNIEKQTGCMIPTNIKEAYEKWFIKHKEEIDNVLMEFKAKKR